MHLSYDTPLLNFSVKFYKINQTIDACTSVFSLKHNKVSDFNYSDTELVL